MNIKNNKRSQETMQKIEDAFVALLQEKCIHEVEVSAICELAQINRSTFYAHYDDVMSLAEAFCERIENQIVSHPHTNGDYSWIFSYIRSHTTVFTAYFKIALRESHADYKILYLRSGAHAVAKMWFESGCVESDNQMGTILKRECDKILNQR